MASIGRKLSSDILVNTLFKLSLKVRGLVLIPLFTLGLSISDYGAYVQVMGVGIIFANLCAFGMDSGIVKFLHEAEQEAYDTVVWTVLSLATVLGLIGGIFSYLVAPSLSIYTLQTREYTLAFALLLAYIPLEVLFRVSRAYYRAERRIKLYSGIEAVDTYIEIATAAFVILILGGGVASVFIGLVIARILTVSAVLLPVIHSIGIARPQANYLGGYVRYAAPIGGSDVSRHLLDKADRLLLGFFIGASAVGIYSTAYSVAYIVLLYINPLNDSFLPEFSQLWEDRKLEPIRQHTISGIRYLTILSIPSVAGFYLVGKDLVLLLSTEPVATASLVPLVTIALGLYCRGINEIYTKLAYAIGDTARPFAIKIIIVTLNIILNIMLIPTYGVVGAAVTTVLSFGIGAVVMAALVQQRLRTLPSPILFVRVGTATIVMLVAMTLMTVPWPVTIATAPVVYFGVLFTIGELKVDEVSSLIRSVAGIDQS